MNQDANPRGECPPGGQRLRIIIPYTVRHPATVEAAPDNAEWYDVSDGPHAYWRLMCRLWDDGQSFMVAEHDVVLRPDIPAGFDLCDQPWCAFPYDNICHWQCMEAWANMLGCTRFTADLIAACPDAVKTIPYELRDWHNLCDHIAGDKLNGVTTGTLRPGSVRAAGYTHHWHLPGVHHHSWDRPNR